MALDPGEVHSRARARRPLSQDLYDQTGHYADAVRDLPHWWSGTRGADAAWTSASALRTDLFATQKPVQDIARAIDDYSHEISGLKQRAAEILAAAEEAGYTVNRDTGEITPPPATEAAAIRHTPAGTLHENGLRQDLTAILGQARRADEAATRVLVANTPGPNNALLYSPAPHISRSEIEAQRGRPPKDVRAWWDGLTPEQRADAIATHPDVVGWLDGVPAVDRDRANRIVLARDRAELEAERARLVEQRNHMPDMGHAHQTSQTTRADLDAEIADIDKKLAGLEQIDQHLNNTISGEPAFLLGIDPNKGANGRVIVAIGDPDAAGNVATFVPGTGSNIRHPGGDIERADLMVHDAAQVDPGKKTSVIMWLGYDAPQDLGAAAAEHYADDARPALRSFQEGLRASHDGPPSHNTVLGHSYGTTVVGFTARDEAGLNADDIVFVASPGTGVDTADGLNFGSDQHHTHPKEHVWATTSISDPIEIVPNGWFGNKPSADGFGGHWFSGDDPGKTGMKAHSGYWDTNNPARRNFSYIITGHGERVG